MRSTPMLRWPQVWDADVDAIAEIYRSGQYASEEPGREDAVAAFEAALAYEHGVAHAICVTNGTHTLSLILEALNIGLGDVVLYPVTTWQATAAAIADVNALPIPVDVLSGTLCMDPLKAEATIIELARAGHRVTALFAVHLYDRAAAMDELAAVCARHNVVLLEDAAHAALTRLGGRGLASVARAASLSFQRSKILPTGEGGAILTNDAVLASTLRTLRNVGITATGSRPVQSGNYRMTEMSGGIGLIGLGHLVGDHLPLLASTFPAFDQVLHAVSGFAAPTAQPNAQGPFYKKRIIVLNDLGLSAEAVRAILGPELLDDDLRHVERPYLPLIDSPFWRPATKPARHNLNPEYWQQIQPETHAAKMIVAPAAYNESVVIRHTLGLDSDGPQQLKEALTKITDNLTRLRAWATNQGFSRS